MIKMYNHTQSMSAFIISLQNQRLREKRTNSMSGSMSARMSTTWS